MKNPIRTLGEHEIIVSPYLNITHTLKIKVNKN
jgi:ribosomal protein L9